MGHTYFSVLIRKKMCIFLKINIKMLICDSLRMACSSVSQLESNWLHRRLAAAREELNKMRPAWNKGAVCLSTTDSSCHLPQDWELRCQLSAPLPNIRHSDFTNSLRGAPVLPKATQIIQKHLIFLHHCLFYVNTLVNSNWPFLEHLCLHIGSIKKGIP